MGRQSVESEGYFVVEYSNVLRSLLLYGLVDYLLRCLNVLPVMLCEVCWVTSQQQGMPCCVWACFGMVDS